MSARSCFLVSLFACGAAVPPLPGKGGPAWNELTSEHFVMWTDASRERGRALIREMEELRQVVIGIGFRGAIEGGQSFVLAVRDDDEAGAFMPGDFAAMASPAKSYIRQPMILLAADSKRDPKGVIAAHELTHTISQAVIKNQPRWFAEGLAKYFETIQIDRGAGMVELGREPTTQGEPMRMVSMMPLARMFACDDLSCVDGHFYVAAWALFTYLTNARGEDLARYEAKLAELPEDPKRAWQQTFGAMPVEQLQAAMQHWLVEGRHQVFKYKVQLRTWQVAERVLGDGDVLAARALLRLQFQEDRDAARQAVVAALAVDATNVLAHVVKLELDASIEAGEARAIARAHPEDWRAWWLVAAAVRNSDEARQAQYTACELIAKNPAIVPPWQPCPTRTPPPSP